MQRRILSFERDEAGDWVARLDCCHRQHVRHRPPFRSAPWVLDDAARAARVGTLLECPLCDRAELPQDLVVVRTTELWDEQTLPAGLRRVHRLADGVWGRLRVESGALRFSAATEPRIDTVLGARMSQPIPPGVDHEVALVGPVSLAIDFLRPLPESG